MTMMNGEIVENPIVEDSPMTRVLKSIGLNDFEIDIYFKILPRGPVLVDEIALIMGITHEDAMRFTMNLLNKGLVREIPGKKPNYMALPPYSALITMLSYLKEMVYGLEGNVSSDLIMKFNEIQGTSTSFEELAEYRGYIGKLKEELPRTVGQQFAMFKDGLEQIKRLYEVRNYIAQLHANVPNEVNAQFKEMQEKLDEVKVQISEALQKQFRIGALQAFAERIVAKAINQAFESLETQFTKRFIDSTQNNLAQVMNYLSSISSTASQISGNLDSTFKDVDVRLKESLEIVDSKINKIYGDIAGVIDKIKKTFQKEVFDKIKNEFLGKIMMQLENSEATMKEFWDRAKQASQASSSEVWFIRSPEAMQAQINDSVSRAKLKFLIIAPTIDLIDIEAMEKAKKMVHFRLVTYWDARDANHMALVQRVINNPNMEVKYYDRKNVWAMNKDFEEIVICVIANPSSDVIQMAGMGSILDEHIKMFAAVTEDIWIQAKKMF